MSCSPASSGLAGVTPVSVYIRLSSSPTFAAVPYAVPFDTVVFDAAGYADVANHRLVVPAGKAGRHLVGCQMELTSLVGAGRRNWQVNNSGANANLIAETDAAPDAWSASTTLVINAAVGDTLDVTVGALGGNDFTGGVSGGSNGCVLWAVYLGTG